ncbi:hypothetical protein [Rasiella sp. SM2506]|uniref:hypothetical protein n=1 Tax=Rasiella sp. SM2506 TaxID=3423914 RepID=UPI003D7A7678
MKQVTPLMFFLCLLFFGNVIAQQEKGIQGSENWLNFWTEFKPVATDHGEPTQILVGNISKDTKLYKKEIYLLLGDIFVTDSSTLTIEPGTIILADYKTKASLTITNGATIIAEGTQTDPIVFTSNRDINKKGDWGGIFILGDAPVTKIGTQSGLDFGLKTSSIENTKYGGENIESNSGIMRFVRIEYAGKRTKKHGYFNALTLAGVGNKTALENIMVSNSAGNSFYVAGGDVNLEKLVSFQSSGNDFKFDLGAHATITNSLAVRSPYVSEPGGASSIYITSHNKDTNVAIEKSKTIVDAQNLTLLNLSKTLEDDIDVGLVREAVYIDKNASLTMAKSVLSGFNPAVILDNSIQVNHENLKQIKFSKMYFNKCRGNIFTEGVTNNEDLENWYGNQSFFNVYSKGSDSETFIDPNNENRPDFRLRINKIIALEEMDRG